MQTTLRLDDELYRRAKVEAARQGITLTRLIEEGIRLRLARPPVAPGEIKLHTAGTGQPSNLTLEELKRLIQETDIQPPADMQP